MACYKADCMAILSFLGRQAALFLLLVLGVVSWPGKPLASDVFFPHVMVPHVDVVGGGVGFYPQFMGSKDYYFGAAPVARIYFYEDMWVRLLVNELRVNLINDENWSAGPVALYRFGRYDVDDRIVNRMDTINDTVELGAFVDYSIFDEENPLRRVDFGAYAEGDVGGVYNGWIAGVSVNGMYPIVRFLTATGGVSTTWASEGFNETYFGVDGDDANVTGLKSYHPGNGMRDVRGYFGLIFHLSENWHIGGGAMYSRLVGQAADSPVVTERGSANQWVWGSGVIYSW